MKEPTARWIEKLEEQVDDILYFITEDLRAELEWVRDNGWELNEEERERLPADLRKIKKHLQKTGLKMTWLQGLSLYSSLYQIGHNKNKGGEQ
jgi:hypothetical protein|tara:strand:- start:349 stop:627 length:279 start_codon:yes stop_codon:yes gene_type:complete